MSPEVADGLAEDFSPEPDDPEPDQKPAFNATVYEALRAQGIAEELARELAACDPDTTEIEVGPREGERTLVWPGSRPATVTLAPTKKPRDP